MKRTILGCMAAFLLSTPLLSQIPLEVGFFAGTTTYQGDLAEDDVELAELHFAFGGFARYHFNDKFKLRTSVIYGHISGRDANAKAQGLKDRNWAFHSYIVEMSLVAEYHPIGRSREDNIGLFRPQISPYIGIGAGFANFDPLVKTTRVGDFGLFPEITNSTSSLTVPVVVGVTFDFSEFFLCGLEAGSRVTFNDYLDGVSKNGNPKRNDLFIFVGVSFTYFIGYEPWFHF